MSDAGYATLRMPVSPVCLRHDCSEQSTAVCVVTGEYGKDGVAAYCDAHADELESSDSHTFIAPVTWEGSA